MTLEKRDVLQVTFDILLPPWVVWKFGLITCVKCEVRKIGMPSNLYDE